MEQEYVLVKYSDNWADEMNLHGFRACPKESWDKYIASLSEIEEDDEHFFQAAKVPRAELKNDTKPIEHGRLK